MCLCKNVFKLVYLLEVCGKMDNLTKLTAAGILISGRISGLPNIRYITSTMRMLLFINILRSSAESDDGNLKRCYDIIVTFVTCEIKYRGETLFELLLIFTCGWIIAFKT